MNRIKLAFAAMLAAVAYAQMPADQPVFIPAQAMCVRVTAVPPSTPATYLDLSVDPSSDGGDVIDVVSSNAQVVISLVLPNGIEVTPTNASGLGFTVFQRVVPLVSSGQSSSLTLFEAVGAHTTFGLPANSPGGVYRVKANSTGVAASANVSATYLPLSGPTAGLAPSPGRSARPGWGASMETASMRRPPPSQPSKR